jgi:phenylacetate-CoA ligase
MNRLLVKHLLYPAHEWLKDQATVHAFGDVVPRALWPPDRLAAYQVSALRGILAFAQAHSTYHRARFAEAGADPAGVRTLADLGRFPFLTKADIRAHRDEIVARGTPDRMELVPFSTGGSTGEPVKFFVDRGRIANEWAMCWRARSWWGLDWGDPWIWLWGSPIELTAQHRFKNLRDRLLNRRLLSAFDMTEAQMRGYVDLIRRVRPRYLYGYASAVFFLAEFMLKSGLRLGPQDLRVVYTTADTLYPHMRTAIERAFGCPVAIEYGSRDGGFLAHECPKGRLHVHADRVVMETVRGTQPVPPGEAGEIVLTELDARAMPFIRYRTGDVGTFDPEPCPCGRGLPVLKALQGRASDFLLARGGRLIHGESITHVLRDLDGIARFRVIQEVEDRLTLDIQRSSPEVTLPVAEIERKIHALFGYPVAVEVRFPAEIELSASGKYRVVRSELTGRYFDAPGGGA